MKIFNVSGWKLFSTALSVVLSFALVALVTYSASTISTNISTGGTLTVTGNSSLNGASTFGDAATDVNLFTGTLQASTTSLFTSGFTSYGLIQASSTSANLLINGFATTTASNGNIATEGTLTSESTITGLTLSITGHSTLTTASTTAITINNTLAVATTTPSQEVGVVGDVHVGSTATTTLTLSSSNANTGGCIQLEGANGQMFRIYATTTGPLIASVGSCQ